MGFWSIWLSIRSPCTSSSSQTSRFPAFVQESFFQAHSASTKQNYSCSGGQMPKGTPLFYVLGTSFSCRASLLQHSHHKDPVSQSEYRTCIFMRTKRVASLFSKHMFEELHQTSLFEKNDFQRYLPKICLC